MPPKRHTRYPNTLIVNLQNFITNCLYLPIMKALFFLLPFILLSCKKPTEQTQTATTNEAWTTFINGADLSYVNQIDRMGGVYRDSGKVKDAFSIFAQHGCNLVRVRLWHNPAWSLNLNGTTPHGDLADATQTLRRAKAVGMATLLDVHYSDTWTDPHKQETPAAWRGLSQAILEDSVYKYTLRTLNVLVADGLTPDMIQIGNENNIGMCHPRGAISGRNYTNFGKLLNAGIRAVRTFSKNSATKPIVVLHVAQFQDAVSWGDGITAAGVTDYDVFGVSHYPKWTTVQSIDSVSIMVDLLKKRYGKKVVILETATPFTTEGADSYNNIIGTAPKGFELTPAGQLAYLKALKAQVKAGGGSGVIYWEPAWITSNMRDLWGKGSAWENCTLFDLKGNTQLGMEWMRP